MGPEIQNTQQHRVQHRIRCTEGSRVDPKQAEPMATLLSSTAAATSQGECRRLLQEAPSVGQNSRRVQIFRDEKSC